MKTRAACIAALCVTAVAGIASISLVSVKDEIEIGRRANAEVRQTIPEMHDARTVAYVASLGRRLVPHARGPKYPYSFHVADYGEINAFALPGGPVWIHRGALQAATNESQVAGVLAHEIAHISQRHAADQLTKTIMANMGLGLLGAMLGNDASAAATRIAAGVMANGIFLKFNRDDEREADRVGMEIMQRAGWDPRGMVELLEILRRESQRDPGRVAVFLSTHPSPADRIRLVHAEAARRPHGRHDSREFQAVKGRLSQMQPPKQMPKSSRQ